MKDKFVVEVINSCCFQHDTGSILKRFSNKNDALAFAYSIKEMSIKETEKFNLDDRYITAMRVLNTSTYPPQEIYYAEIERYIPDYKESDVPTWSESYE